MMTLDVETSSEAETEALGGRLASAIRSRQIMYLRGPLGAGKTTFVRGLLRGLGHTEAVKSPTFTLVEPYDIDDITLYHFDLYRVADPRELEFLALRDYIGSGNICIVEWPERGAGVLPPPDLDVMIRPSNNEGRALQLQAHTPAGEAVLGALR